MSVRNRWLKKLNVARHWAAVWRQRYIWNPTRHNKWKLEQWRQRAAYAERVLDRHPPTPDALVVSKRGIERIMGEEGIVLHPYNDPAGHATIGVGHLLHHGNVTAADRVHWAGFTRDDAIQLLDRDLDRFERAVRESVKVPLTQNQFDALVSLAFNIGEAGFRGSTVVKRLNAKDYRGAADAFRMWDNPAMLRPRRERERQLFLS